MLRHVFALGVVCCAVLCCAVSCCAVSCCLVLYSNPSLAEMAAELLMAGRSSMRQALEWLKQGVDQGTYAHCPVYSTMCWLTGGCTLSVCLHHSCSHYAVSSTAQHAALKSTRPAFPVLPVDGS